jgi:chorismate mutase
MAETPEFAVVASLLATIADAKSCEKRLHELRTTIERSEAATAKLEAARQAHDAAVAAAKASADARETALRKREADMAAREGRQAHYDKLIARWKQQRDFPDGDLQPSSSLRRDHHA